MFGEEEVEAAKSISLFLESGLGEESIAEITRVLGEGMSRLAATTSAAFVEAFLEAGDSEDEVAERFATLAEQLVPAIDPVLSAAYKQHLAEAVRRGMLGSAERETGEAGGAQDVAVCFVDMVGFTRLGAEIEAQELGSLATKLAELANDVTQPPVRLVKTIGDAAMFVSPDPGALVVGRAVAARGRRGRGPAEPARRGRVRVGAAARGRLLRPRGQSGQPRHRGRPSRQRPLHPGGTRRRSRPVRLVVRAQAQAQGHARAALALPGAPAFPGQGRRRGDD